MGKGGKGNMNMMQAAQQQRMWVLNWVQSMGMYMQGMEFWDDNTWAEWQGHLMQQGKWDLENWGDWYGLMSPQDWETYKAMKQENEKWFSWKPPGGFDSEGNPLDKDGNVIPLDEDGQPKDEEMWKIFAEQMGWLEEYADGEEDGDKKDKKKG